MVSKESLKQTKRQTVLIRLRASLHTFVQKIKLVRVSTLHLRRWGTIASAIANIDVEVQSHDARILSQGFRQLREVGDKETKTLTADELLSYGKGNSDAVKCARPFK